MPAETQAKTETQAKAESLTKMVPNPHYTKWVWSLIGLIGLGVVLWFWGIAYIFGPVVSVAPLARSEFVQTLVASGHIEAPFRVSIGAQITGIVASIPVVEGQQVKAGDVLLTLDNREALANVHDSEGAVAGAGAHLRQISELTLPAAVQSLKQLQSTLANVQQTFDRVNNLKTKGFETQANLDEATKNLAIAQSQLNSGRLNVFTNSPEGSDYVVAQTQLAQANSLLRAAKFRLDYTTVRAPKDGILIARSAEVGDVAQPAKELMVLSPTGTIQITVDIDERDLGSLALGQPALASADAYSKQNFLARVSFINPGINLQKASVEVKLDVANPPVYLSQDMTISVDIEVARRPSALIVPAGDVHDNNGKAPWVLKAAGGHAVKQAVDIGILSAGKAEILSGLVEGDIIVPNALGLVDGARLRVASPAAKP